MAKFNNGAIGGLRRNGVPDDPNEAISEKLKALYSSVEQEKIPDRFLDLLERLDAAEAAAEQRVDAKE